MKLIQTKDYLLLIDEVSGFKRGDWNYEIDNNIPIYQFGYDIDKYPGDKIIAYRKLNEEAKELDLPRLPPFEEIDVEELAEQYLQKWRKLNNTHLSNTIHADRCKNDFIAGYKAAQSKQFSLEDMLDAFEYGLSKPEFQLTRSLKEDFEKFIQSLSTQQLPKEFIPEYEDVFNKTDCCSILDNNYHTHSKKLKTIINSEGKEVLVGTYKY